MWSNKSYGDADFILFGAPFDSTTSYRPGTRFASKAMRTEFYGLETYSPYLDMDLEEAAVHDAGDIELCIGEVKTALAQIEEFASRVMNDNKIPAMVGGEHLVTLPVIKALQKKYDGLHVIHFDAHADLRDDYLGAKLSHATVMRRVWELLGDGRIFQYGIRSGDKSEFTWGRGHVHTHKFNFDGLPETIAQLKNKPVYLSIDLDVLDPSIFPATGTPEAGGVSFEELRTAICGMGGLNIVGFDLVELSPPYDSSGVSTAVACKILRELLLILKRSE